MEEQANKENDIILKEGKATKNFLNNLDLRLSN